MENSYSRKKKLEVKYHVRYGFMVGRTAIHRRLKIEVDYQEGNATLKQSHRETEQHIFEYQDGDLENMVLYKDVENQLSVAQRNIIQTALATGDIEESR